MQYVRTNKVFSLLHYIAILVSWYEFWRDWCIYDVEQGESACWVNTTISHIGDDIPDEGLRNRDIYTIHGHVVAIVGSPSKSEFRQITCSYHHTVELVAEVHEYLCALASLTILIGHIMHIDIVVDIFKVLDASLLDTYLANGDAKRLHQTHSIGVSAVCSTKAWHGDSHDTCARHLEFVECLDTHKQSKGGIQTTTDANDNSFATSMHQSLGKTSHLNIEYLFA